MFANARFTQKIKGKRVPSSIVPKTFLYFVSILLIFYLEDHEMSAIYFFARVLRARSKGELQLIKKKL